MRQGSDATHLSWVDVGAVSVDVRIVAPNFLIGNACSCRNGRAVTTLLNDNRLGAVLARESEANDLGRGNTGEWVVQWHVCQCTAPVRPKGWSSRR